MNRWDGMRPLFFAGVLVGWLIGCSGGGSQGPVDAGFDGGIDGGADLEVTCVDIGQCPAKQLCLEGVCKPGTFCDQNTACPADYQCLIMKQVCVPENPCGDDTGCEIPKPYCLTASGVCVACKQDDHCLEGYRCDGSFQCVPEGPACSGDAQCTAPGKTHCDLTTGTCVGCVNDGHCPGQVCDLTSHQCVQCTGDGTCQAPKPRCLVSTHTCVECLEKIDCTGEERCNLSSYTCTTVVCGSDNDCLNEQGKPKCNTATGDCVECKVHADCGAYGFCRDFACSTECVADQECQDKLGANYRCRLETGDCFVAECLNDGECAGKPATLHCKTTATGSGAAPYTCVACTETAHCPEMFECDSTNACRPMACYKFAEPDASCQQIDACFFCDQQTGSCSPKQACTPNGNECCTGYSCDNYSCVMNLYCTDGKVCAPGYVCNPTTEFCDWQTSCNPKCTAGKTCDETTHQCVTECHKQMEACGATAGPCCEGYRCGMFFLCVPA